MPLTKIILRTNLVLGFCLLSLQSCGIFSFTSGTNLPDDIKTFSIEKFYVETTDAPLNVDNELTEALEEKILRMTTLTRKHEDGDIQYQGTIKSFSYSTNLDNSYSANNASQSVEVTTLTIILEVSYKNTINQENSFKNKCFSASSSIINKQNPTAQEKKLIQETIQKLVENIYNASIDNW